MRSLLLLLLLLAACAAPGGATSRERPLELFWDREEGGGARTSQIRPFYWRREDERGKQVNVLAGLVRYRENERFRYFHVFPIASYTARTSPQELRSWFLAVWPFVLVGSNDFLLLPFGGVTRGFLGIDELVMVTPFYIRSRWVSKHRTDPTTFTVRSILWPFIAWGSDGKPGGRRKFRVAPFYGRSLRRGGERAGFVLWPFYTWRRKSEVDRGFFLFPFYGKDRTPTQVHTTILFPFYHRSEDLLTGARDVAVWPFWRRAGGADGAEVHRYWPAVEYRRHRWNTTQYVAWPFWRRSYREDARGYDRLTWLLPFYNRFEHVSKLDRSVETKTLVWPAARWYRYPDGGKELMIPTLLPSHGRQLREYLDPIRPFVSLWHRRTHPNGDRDTSALFGLYLARRTGETKKVRLLGGLIGWDRREDGRYLRLLWAIRLRIGK